MASKRQLKKRISTICGALAGDILLASHLSSSVDRNKVEDIVRSLAALQEDTRNKVKFAFDKTVKDFAGDGAAYRKALNKYNKAAYDKLAEQFHARLVEILKEMNEAVPAETRKALS